MKTLVFIMLLATVTFAQVDLEKGLVGYYSFDQINGAVVVNQATGENKGPDGEIADDPVSGAVPEVVPGVSGDALLFSTSNTSHVALGEWDPSEKTDMLAVSCWVYWQGLDGNWQPIAGLRDGWDPPTIGWSMVLDIGNGGLQFETNTPNGKVYIITPQPPELEDWTHVVLNFDGGMAAYYFNNEWMVEGEMQFGEGRYTSPFRIGAGWTNGNGFNGIIDEFRVYDRTLTNDEIKFLYENPGGVIDAVKTAPQMPKQFTLQQNHPNPFNPSTTISYSIEQTDFVTLRVYNMLGENVATLVDQVQTPGVYSTHFDAGDLPVGIYMYRLTVGPAFDQTKKMLLLK